MNNRVVLASAFAAAIAAPSISAAQAPTPTPVAPPAYEAEHCYGIALAGQNDCASTGNNSCGGTSLLDGDPNAWVYVPVGYCERLVGGSLEPGGAGAVARDLTQTG